MTSQVEELLKKGETKKSERVNFETKWQEVNNFFSSINNNIIIDRSKGDKSYLEKLVTSIGNLSVLTLASILNGTLTSKSSKWFSLEPLDEELVNDKEVADYLGESADKMRAKMYEGRSNFENSLLEAYKDTNTIGTIATIVNNIKGENGNFKNLNYRTLNIANFLIDDNEEGKSDYFVKFDKMTVRQIMNKWEDDQLATINENIKKKLAKEPFHKFDIQLHIFPRDKRDKTKIDVLNKPIAGFWIDVKHKSLIKETGFDVMPVAIGRSEKSSDEEYGTSRAMVALPTTRQINIMIKQISEATELALHPSLIVNRAFDKAINQSPRALNFTQGALQSARPAIEQMTTIGALTPTENLIKEFKEEVEKIFFLDKLKILDDPRATATQVLELRAETFRIMGALATSLEEYLSSILDITYDILFRESYDVENGTFNLKSGAIFGKLPDKLKPNEAGLSPSLKVVFNNPIAQAQKTLELNALDSFMLSVTELANFFPEVLDNINIDEVVKKKRAILNIDPDILRESEEEVKTVEEVRGERAEQIEQQQTVESIGTLAPAANQAKQAGII